MSALDERRRAAHEAYESAADWAYYDAPDGAGNHEGQLEAAIEVATQVRITPDVLTALTDVYGHLADDPEQAQAGLAAAFRAAGFEVEW